MSDDPARRVLIVDDHPIVRRGLRQILEAERDLTVCGEAGDARRAVELVEEQAPDLVLVDLALEGTHGLALTRQLAGRWPELPVLIVSMHDERLYAPRALEAGARGYVTKQAGNDELVDAVRRVLDGRLALSDAVQRRLDDGRSVPLPGATDAVLEELSDREFEVFQLLGQGFAPRHIAERLSVSVKTVEVYRHRLKEKLGIENAALLTRYAVEWDKQQRPSA